MTPRIIHPKGWPENAFLVDADNLVYAPRFDSKGIKWKAGVFRQAIQIRDLCAGEIVTNKGHTFPRPCQIIGPAMEWVLEEFPPYVRKIHDHPAKVLLSMPLMQMSLSPKPRNRGKLGNPTVAKGYNDWKFLTAWCWSKWEEERSMNSKAWSIDGRWLAMKNQLGYPYTRGTFGKMCAAMELFVTDSRKKR